MDERVPDAVAVIYDPDDPIPLLGRPACPACLADHAAADHLYQYVPICPDPVVHRPAGEADDDRRADQYHPAGLHDHPGS
jgi:hypothetical protein